MRRSKPGKQGPKGKAPKKTVTARVPKQAAPPRISQNTAGLFPSPAVRKKIIPQGLVSIVQGLESDAIINDTGGSFFKYVILIFSDEINANLFGEVVKKSGLTMHAITFNKEQKEQFGNNARGYSLALARPTADPTANSIFLNMSIENPTLHGFLLMQALEKEGVIEAPKKFYAIDTAKFINFGTLPNMPKMKLEGIKLVVLTLEKFLGKTPGLSFCSVICIFETAKKAKEFQGNIKKMSEKIRFEEQLRGRPSQISKEISLEEAFSVRPSLWPRFFTHENNDTFMELHLVSNSDLDFMVRKNLHVRGSILLSALGHFFDISQAEIAVFDTLQKAWVLQPDDAKASSSEPEQKKSRVGLGV